MLSNVSWQQYFAAVIIIAGLYYLYVIARYYREAFFKAFQSKRRSPPDADTPSPRPTGHVLGDARDSADVSFVDQEELRFAPVDELIEKRDTSPTTHQNKDQPPSAGQGLYQQANELIDAFRETNDKEGFLTLFRILVGPYERCLAAIDLRSSIEQIAGLARSKLPFPVTVAEFHEQTN
ncbi:hypothetical protein LLH06_07960 [Mucilaginibacter daejeonensis]|uniref:hypothetical protein n=1 Tax=Mucilaginibacter daejeonensis TaxID=398049 RepID=UPI001D1790A6|nr:hypothetical protein [Mucilaginibacter daejeonensis]UEG54898.1 hypothetical protein LLH06_07960 [Mucilaginibacter daejeonensis]